VGLSYSSNGEAGNSDRILKGTYSGAWMQKNYIKLFKKTGCAVDGAGSGSCPTVC
jgi:hypothetical protein